MTTPSKSTIIGRFQNDAQRNDFLQLENKDGGLVFGGIDGQGVRYGSLASGSIQGVLVKTSDYQVTSDDNGQLISVNSSGTVNITLPVIAPDNPWFIQVECIGSGTVSLQSTPTVDGSSTPIVLSQNQGLVVVSNGTVYYTMRGVGGNSGTGFAGVSAQTGDYTALSADVGKLLTFSKTSAVTLTLPASAPGNTWFIYVQNTGTGILTVNRNGLNIDGAAGNLTLLKNQGEMIFCDGSNYFTSRGVSGIGSVNSQTGDYTALPSDSGKLITVSKLTAVTLTLPATSPGPNWTVFIQNTGVGDLTIARNGLNIDGVASNLVLNTTQGVIIYTDGTNYFTERGCATATNVALKPSSLAGIQFVSPAGSDSNDGLSWGSAKLHIMVAYDALPSSGGTIYFTEENGEGPAATSTSTEGIWIMGSADPNYASPPAGWRRAKAGAVTFQGAIASITGGTSTVPGSTHIHTPPSASGTGNPTIWLSGVSGHSFCNLGPQYPARNVYIGVNSNGVKDGSIANSNIVFRNCRFSLNQVAASGPNVTIGPNCLWILFDSCHVAGNNAAAIDTDNRCAFVVDPNSSAGSLIWLQDVFGSSGGGLKWYANANSSEGMRVRNYFMEGQGTDTQPLINVVGSNQAFVADIDLNGGSTVDGSSVTCINIDPRMRPSQVAVRGAGVVEFIGLNGPLTVFGSPSSTNTFTSVRNNGVPVANVSPAAKGQRGTWFGQVIDQVDDNRRAFSPSLARFANNLGSATQLPASWTAGKGTVTVTPGISAPDGSTNAGRLTSSANDGAGNSSGYFFNRSIIFAAGDYCYAGFWARPASSVGFRVAAGITNSCLAVNFPGGGTAPTLRVLTGSSVDRTPALGTAQTTGMGVPNSYYQTDGGWQWIWGIFKIVKPTTGTTQFECVFDTTTPVDVYGPVFAQVPYSSFSTITATTVDTSGNSGATQSGNTVTIKTTSAHNLTPGMIVVISGVTASGYNGEFVVATCPTTTTFTYYNTTTGLSTSGSGTVTPSCDTEAVDWARTLKSYPDGIAAGIVSTLRRERLAFGGSGDDFLAILDHTALSANRTITVPDGDGNMVLTGSANVFSAAQEFDNGIKIGSGGTLLTQAVIYLASLTPSSVNANTSAEQDFSVAGVTTADTISIAGPAPTAGTGIVNCRVKSNGVVSITFGNFTGGSLTPTSGTYRILAVRS